MKIDDIEIGMQDNILIFTSKNKGVTIEEIEDLKSFIEETTGKQYHFGLFRSILGYYSGYDFFTHKSLFSGSMNLLPNIQKIKEYEMGNI